MARVLENYYTKVQLIRSEAFILLIIGLKINIKKRVYPLATRISFSSKNKL
jgi:hypothetical protein